ncbi:MAG TPA: alanine--tRNA ligase [Vicinamibacterales bacterium]|nr:alanine--tRNA ligase [Vicinamibacterales bacterium]
MHSREIRTGFLAFFERHGHRIVPSSSLVPADDPSLLFTNAGMNQFKDTFLGKEKRGYTRATTSQKCMRVSGKHNDLDNVGPSFRHHTFFEMLGNFSFGDYFKEDAIAYAWDLLTAVWRLPPDRLYPTIFRGENAIPRDVEAWTVWTRFVPADRIAELGASENFWQMGDSGPCGRCSEIHFFRGEHVPCPHDRCEGPNCDCDRFVEVWNNVFMEFDRQPDGTLNPLPAPSIDTGMGLERIAAVIQAKLSNYDTDLFTPILADIGERTGRRYGGASEDPADVSMRVIADHIRAMTFLIADGVVPSNEWRGYVLRKIMRRAMRHGHRLGRRDPFLHTLVDTLVGEMGGQYPELRSNRDAVVQVIRSEEERFDAVLGAGLPRLEEALDRAAAGSRILPGDEIFRLYDSLGMPLDFIEDLAGQRGIAIDREGYDRAMEAQREKGRAGSAFEAKRAAAFSFTSDAAREALAASGDAFEGYAATRVSGVPVLAVFDDDRRQTTALHEGQHGWIVLQKTPFYVEAGGQVSDSGRVFSQAGKARATVEGMARVLPNGPRAHRVHVTSGSFKERDLVTAEVIDEVRDATRRNHTATHLLHAALRQVLGGHVKQAGSLVAPDRLRFDFVHFSALTHEQVEEIERIVNAQIYRNTPVQTEVRSTEDAVAAGAMALFGEKYGDRVRVVTVPGFSMELCGGTHCRATGDIGFFTVTAEEGVAAGVRRIEALTGAGALAHVQHQRSALAETLAALGTGSDQAADAIRRLQAEMKRLSRENEQLKTKLALGGGRRDENEGGAIDVAGVKVLARRLAGVEKSTLRSVADQFRDRLGSGVVILAAETDGKAVFVVSVTKDLADRVHAGKIVKEIAPIVGGGGGGRPDFAEAGGKDASKIDDLLAGAQEVVRRMLAG